MVASWVAGYGSSASPVNHLIRSTKKLTRWFAGTLLRFLVLRLQQTLLLQLALHLRPRHKKLKSLIRNTTLLLSRLIALWALDLS
jgi:hypothetical protein